ncbi:MAG: DUF3727 domain-containing protein [Cyanothece sp. SIO1E1]|nr:DUF3727 domain-containing protein [Cyanothece sp. SIO1E1]
MDEEGIDLNQPTISLTDEEGRSLICYIERSLEIEQQSYVLLMPVNVPVEIFAWEPEDEDEEILVDIEDAEVDQLFATARAVLAEHDLALHRTALTLTVTGDLPEAADIFTLDIEASDEVPIPESEQFQMLATFFHEEQEYTVCTPLEPLLFFARMTHDGAPALLSPEELQQIQPQLEDKLFDVLE